MTPVRLDRLVTLEGVVQVADGAGGFSQTWTALGTHWAQVRTTKGRVRAIGAVAMSEVPTQIVVRGAPTGAVSRPVPDQRFREGARRWRILAVTELDPHGRYLRCDTVEETAA